MTPETSPAEDDQLRGMFAWRMGPFRRTLRWDLSSTLDLAERPDGLDRPTAEALFLSGVHLTGAAWKALESGGLRRQARLTARQVEDVRRVLTSFKGEVEAHNSRVLAAYHGETAP